MMRLLSKFDDWVRNRTQRTLCFFEDRLAPFTLMVLAAMFILLILFWGWLGAGESGSATIRNLGLVIAAIIGLPLAIWRSKVAERQADMAQRQSETAQSGLLNERYQKGAEMLGSKVLPVRLGGIYALEHLAENYPEEYCVLITALFCAFARHPTAQDSSEQQLRPDVQAVIEAIATCHERVESEKSLRIDLRGADLSYAALAGGNLSGAILTGSNLTCAYLTGANLSGAYLYSTDTNLTYAILMGANLSDADLSNADLFGARLGNVDLSNAKLVHTRLEQADLSGADLTNAYLSRSILTGANLSNTILSNTDFSGDAYGLTQAQLDKATPAPDHPPRLNGLVDAGTGEPLVWHG